MNFTKKLKEKKPKDSVLYCKETKKFLHWSSKEDMWVLSEYTKPQRVSTLLTMLSIIPHSREKYPETERIYHKDLTKELFVNLVIVKAKRSMEILDNLEETK